MWSNVAYISNKFAWIASGIPAPVSLTVSLTKFSLNTKGSKMDWSDLKQVSIITSITPYSVYFRAFESKFKRIYLSLFESEYISNGLIFEIKITFTCFASAYILISSIISPTKSYKTNLLIHNLNWFLRTIAKSKIS